MKMQRYIVFISMLIVVAALFFLLGQEEIPREENIQTTVEINSTSACFKDNCFKIKIADSQEERETGLMFVSQMPEDEGMLFIFDQPGVYPFWMKNTLIPLDIMWLDENGNVVFIKKNAEPCQSGSCPSINPGVPAKYVLEINAGLIDKILG